MTIAAIASFAGGTIGAILLMVFAPALSSVALLFHSAEYFALMVVGLSAIAAFAGMGQVAKAIPDASTETNVHVVLRADARARDLPIVVLGEEDEVLIVGPESPVDELRKFSLD